MVRLVLMATSLPVQGPRLSKERFQSTSQNIKVATAVYHVNIAIGNTHGSAANSPSLGMATNNIVRGLGRFVARDISLEEKVTSLTRDIAPVVRSLFSPEGVQGLSRSFVSNV